MGEQLPQGSERASLTGTVADCRRGAWALRELVAQDCSSAASCSRRFSQQSSVSSPISPRRASNGVAAISCAASASVSSCAAGPATRLDRASQPAVTRAALGSADQNQPLAAPQHLSLITSWRIRTGLGFVSSVWSTSMAETWMAKE